MNEKQFKRAEEIKYELRELDSKRERLLCVNSIDARQNSRSEQFKIDLGTFPPIATDINRKEVIRTVEQLNEEILKYEDSDVSEFEKLIKIEAVKFTARLVALINVEIEKLNQEFNAL